MDKPADQDLIGSERDVLVYYLNRMREDEKDSLRRIMAHVLRETSRHAGHADILRELIDGATAL